MGVFGGSSWFFNAGLWTTALTPSTLNFLVSSRRGSEATPPIWTTTDHLEAVGLL